MILGKKATALFAICLLGTGIAMGAAPAASKPTGTVNLNTASAEQIALLPRVGAKVAQRVVDYRKANGNFKRSEDVMEVKGIGEKLFTSLKEHLTVTGPTTLSAKVKSTGIRSRSRTRAPKAA